MKTEFTEHEGCFSVDLVAETMAEAALLVRFGMNRTDKLNHVTANVSQAGEFDACIIFAKSKRANSDVPKRQ